MTEADILRAIMLEVGSGPVRVFRNNVGLAWTGTVIKRTADTLTLRDPRPLHAGLCVGSSDLIGWRTVTVTPEMVGQRLAQFVALEVKAPRGRVSPEQQQFVDTVNAAGGIGVIARSVGEAKIIC
jgi:hypothetical protein